MADLVDVIPEEDELRREIRALMAEKHRLRILVAWQAALLSEGAACALLGVDRVEARGMVHLALADASTAWSEYRATNPPEVATS